MAIKTTIQIDEALAARLREIVPPRGLNRFINQAVTEKVEALERTEIEKAMIEGYIASAHDRDQLNADWEVVDVEDWPQW